MIKMDDLDQKGLRGSTVQPEDFQVTDELIQTIAATPDQYLFSLEEENENWQFAADRNEAIAEGTAQALQSGYDRFYIARAEAVEIPYVDCAESILDQLDECFLQIYDHQPTTENPLFSRETVDELNDGINEVIKEWINRHKLKPNYFIAVDIETVESWMVLSD